MLLAPSSSTAIAEGYDDTLLKLCKAGGDALRLQVLRVLSRDAYTVQELCSILDCRQSGMSHHLKILTSAGLITRRREGNSLFYRRNFQAVAPGLNRLHDVLLDSVDAMTLTDSVQSRLEAVVAERAASSRAFFTEHASEFRQQQEQMVAFEVYGSSCEELLLGSQPEGGDLAIEIGPGEGAFLASLSLNYRRVIGLDNSPSMLERAAQFVADRGLTNIELLLGDSRSPTLATVQADCVVANMVLHHVPSPADIFRDAAALLRPGGLFCVTDLCRHDQSWAREACGDVWLGFEPEDLSDWARVSGLTEGPSAYMAQLNGFRVQVRQFLKPESTTSFINPLYQ